MHGERLKYSQTWLLISLGPCYFSGWRRQRLLGNRIARVHIGWGEWKEQNRRRKQRGRKPLRRKRVELSDGGFIITWPSCTQRCVSVIEKDTLIGPSPARNEPPSPLLSTLSHLHSVRPLRSSNSIQMDIPYLLLSYRGPTPPCPGASLVVPGISGHQL